MWVPELFDDDGLVSDLGDKYSRFGLEMFRDSFGVIGVAAEAVLVKVSVKYFCLSRVHMEMIIFACT